MNKEKVFDKICSILDSYKPLRLNSSEPALTKMGIFQYKRLLLQFLTSLAVYDY